ncbi:FecCD family ABC transporter permease [Pandoraea sp. NPDC087047]|uniref:FecCD family ABC transporter permease n=1 Tax=Pandoraea sp. NPDC087047 TaxID=3364390 RepID=UPI003804B2D0
MSPAPESSAPAVPTASPTSSARLAQEDVLHAGVANGYRQLNLRRAVWLIGLAALIVFALAMDFTHGPSALGWRDLWRTLVSPGTASPDAQVIVWQIRLPYALMAVLVGGSLGLAGGEMQTILDNPLASPYTLGVSAAAAFGAALAIVLNLHVPGVPDVWVVPVNAFIFALISALVLDGVARWRGLPTSGVVLMGIALVFVFHALVSLMQFVATEDALQGLVFWTLGSLTRSDWTQVRVLGAVLAIMAVFAWRQSWAMTALRLGEDRAASFGIRVARLRLITLMRVSLLSALTVSFVGTIGFVGLVAPHIARGIFGEDHRFYLPGCVIVGALVMSLASMASKTLLPGVIIPVGIVTALVGIPFFLVIVVRSSGRSL